MAELKSILKQGSNMIVFWFISSFLGFFSNIVFTHYLNPASFGNFTLLRTIINILAIFSLFGLNHGLLRQGSLAMGRENQDLYSHIRNYTISYALTISIGVCLLVFLGSNIIATYIFKNPSLDILIKCCSIVIPIQVTNNMIMSLFQVNKQADKGQFLYLVVYFALQPLIFYLLTFFLQNDALIIISYLAANFIYYFILLFYQRKFKFKFRFQLEKKEKKALFGISFPMFLAGALSQSQKWTDTLFLGILGTNTEVGIYYVGLRLAIFASIPANAFNQIFMPIAGRLMGKNKHDELNDLYKTITRLIFICGSLIFGTIFFLKTYVLHIFGAGYESSSSILIFILISETVDFGVGPATRLITMSGGGRINLINSVITLSISIIASYMLIPKYGMLGAAIANAVTNISMQILTVVELITIYKLSPFNLKYFFAIISFTGCFLIVSFLPLNDLLKFSLFIASMSFIYGFLIVDKKEKMFIKEVFLSKLKLNKQQ